MKRPKKKHLLAAAFFAVIHSSVSFAQIITTTPDISDVLNDRNSKVSEAVKKAPTKIYIVQPEAASGHFGAVDIKLSILSGTETLPQIAQYNISDPDGDSVAAGYVCGQSQSCKSRVEFEKTIDLSANRSGAYRLNVQAVDAGGNVINVSRAFFKQQVFIPTGPILFPLPANPYDDLKIASHNVWFMTILGTNIGGEGNYQDVDNIEARARAIVSDGYLKGQDIVVLNELFDNGASDILLNGLSGDYPNQTDVAGRSRGQSNWDATLGDFRRRARLEAGVAIVSKWPIKKKIQYLFPKSELCGYDALANKGFAYANIHYQNRHNVHIIATHLQAEDQGCDDANTAGYTAGYSARSKALRRIRSFIDDQNIPSTEPVFVVGDLNIIKGLQEHDDMLRTLNASPSIHTGNRGTYDGTDNPLIGNSHYPQILDYILALKGHAAPSNWYSEIRKLNGFADHYPVFASSQKTGREVNPNMSEFFIRITTSGRRQAGTNNDIIAILNDDSGRKSRIITLNPRLNGDIFERGDVDTIKLESMAPMDPESVTLISHERFCCGPDWRISRIEILDRHKRLLKSWSGDFELDDQAQQTFPLN